MEHLNELLAHLAEVTLVTLQGESSHNAPADQPLKIENDNSGLHSHQQLILDIIQNGDPEYGAERNNIKKQVPPNVAPKVDEILEFLSSEGHIYTTKTDDYFKAIWILLITFIIISIEYIKIYLSLNMNWQTCTFQYQ